MKKSKFIFTLVIFFASYSIFSDSIIDKAFDDAKAFYLMKEYPQAYSRIKFALRNYLSYDDIPFEMSIVAENIYYDYLESLSKNNEETKLYEIFYKDTYFSLMAERSKRLGGFKTSYEHKKETENKKRELEDKRKEEERARKDLLDFQRSNSEQFNKQLEAQLEEQRKKSALELKQKQIEYEQFLKTQERLNKEKLEAEEKSREQLNRILETTIISRKDEAKAERENLVLLIISISVIIGVFFVLMFVVIMTVIKASHKHQERMFEFQMHNFKIAATGLLNIPQLAQAPINPQYLIAGANVTDVKAIPAPDKGMQKLQSILVKSKEIGEEIEKRTARKNSCKNVAELIYKITKSYDYDEKTCMAYFCAALVHDIGLLDIDESFFRAEKLTDKQYEILKSHTKISADKINFIDEEYKSIFMEAITKHHENIDGSGYPNGLTDGDIPEIARMIRVVESYIALVSSRVYRNIADKQSAIGELLQNSDKYDKKIVEALDNVL